MLLVIAYGNNSLMPYGNSPCPYLLSFGSDPEMGSAEMLSAFSFSNLKELSRFPLKRSEDIYRRYLYIVVVFFHLYEIHSFFFPFWANSEFWSVLIYQWYLPVV